MDYEYVIFDAPPSETIADANVLSQYTNLNLFLISLNKVERNAAKKVINKLSKITESQIGVVINHLKEEDNLLSDYGYKYKYNNEIYKYYKSGDKDEITNEKINEKKTLNLDFSKAKILKIWKRFKNWIDF